MPITSMSAIPEGSDTLGPINIPFSVKKEYKRICDVKGTTMKDEIIRMIYGMIQSESPDFALPPLPERRKRGEESGGAG